MAHQDDDAGRVWVIDTSSVIEVRRLTSTAQAPKFYAKLTQLVTADRLFFPEQVLTELGRSTGNLKTTADLPLDWAKEVQQAATRHGMPIKEVAEVVMREVPEVLDSDKEHEEADPYVLGLALHIAFTTNAPVTVITQEHRDRDDKMSMGTACGLLGLPSVPLRAFATRRGYWGGRP